MKHTKPTAASSVSRPLPPYGLRGVSEAAEAKLPNLSKPCPECDGKGEDYWMALDATEYSLEDCPFCDGTGLIAKTRCDCGEPLDERGWCAACEDYEFPYGNAGALPSGWSRIEL